MKINLDQNTEEARIEIIPLIDVIFCILTFFILASLQLTRQQAISVDLPQAKTGTPQSRDLLIVTMDDLGQVYVEKSLMNSKDDLIQALRNYSYTNPTGLMVLYAPKNAKYDEVVQLLDILRSVGGTRVALATLPGDGSQKVNGNSPVIPTIPGGDLPEFNPNVNPNINPNSNNGVNIPLNPSSTDIPTGIPNPAPSYNPLQPNNNPNQNIPTNTLPNNSGVTPVTPNNNQPNSTNPPNNQKP